MHSRISDVSELRWRAQETRILAKGARGLPGRSADTGARVQRVRSREPYKRSGGHHEWNPPPV